MRELLVSFFILFSLKLLIKELNATFFSSRAAACSSRAFVVFFFFFFFQTISSSQLLLVFHLCHHGIVTDIVPLGTPLTWGPLIPGDPSYLETPHTWGPLIPGDPSYSYPLAHRVLVFEFSSSLRRLSFFQSTSFSWLLYLCHHDIGTDSVWMRYFLTF